MEETQLELRMYSLVMYNLSGIQKGIQAYHATIEGARMSVKVNTEIDQKFLFDKDKYDEWADRWKTVIILSGGGSMQMEEYHSSLIKNEIRHAIFREPDLNNATSAISFLVDERVFNYKDYPDFRTYIEEIGGQKIKKKVSLEELKIDYYVEYANWAYKIGGPYNVFLKEWLTQFRLA